jgi:hypothetical protein
MMVVLDRNVYTEVVKFGFFDCIGYFGPFLKKISSIGKRYVRRMTTNNLKEK